MAFSIAIYIYVSSGHLTVRYWQWHIGIIALPFFKMVILQVVSGHSLLHVEKSLGCFGRKWSPSCWSPSSLAVEIIIHNTQLINYTQLISYLSFLSDKSLHNFLVHPKITINIHQPRKKSEAGEWVVAVSGGGLDHLAAPWHMLIRSTLDGWSVVIYCN